MTTQHTPGPWTDEGHDGKRCVLVTSQWGTVAAVWPIGAVDQERGNARLISAAPELLEELKLAADAFDYVVRGLALGQTVSVSSLQNCAANARAAIAKAEGRNS